MSAIICTCLFCLCFVYIMLHKQTIEVIVNRKEVPVHPSAQEEPTEIKNEIDEDRLDQDAVIQAINSALDIKEED